MQQIRATVAREFEQVNQLIVDQLHSNVPMVENVGHYIVDAGGKRLRPLLVLLSAAALGGCNDSQIKFAAVIEFIHTATLLHDDVVDISSLRRGRPTANAEFGNAPSVLVGDFLYTRAFQLMVQLDDMPVLQHMADTTNTIAEGEVLPLEIADQAGAVFVEAVVLPEHVIVVAGITHAELGYSFRVGLPGGFQWRAVLQSQGRVGVSFLGHNAAGRQDQAAGHAQMAVKAVHALHRVKRAPDGWFDP